MTIYLLNARYMNCDLGRLPNQDGENRIFFKFKAKVLQIEFL